jgi:hypothetical protein
MGRGIVAHRYPIILGCYLALRQGGSSGILTFVRYRVPLLRLSPRRFATKG